MRDLLKIVIPDKTEIIIFGLLGIVMMLILNAQRLLLLFGNVSLQEVNNALSLDAGVAKFIVGFESTLDPRVVDVLIWMLVGLVTFLAFSFFIGWWHSVREEVSVVEYYRHPRNYHAGHEINTFLTKGAIRALGAVGLIVWFFVFFGLLSQKFSNIFLAALTSLSDLPMATWVILTPLLYGVGLYIFAIFIRMTTLRVRVFG